MNKIAKAECSNCAMVAYGTDIENLFYQIDDDLYCNFCEHETEIILITKEQHEKEKRQFINNLKG